MKAQKYQLNSKDHQKLSSLLKRDPNTLEKVLALALWNEHCSYRSSKKHLRKFQFPTDRKISALGEQAGVIDLGRGERISFKMESHNHPSYLIPYHGSATGVGGILRDIFAMNARPIALADYLCFAGDFKDSEVSLKKEHAERVDQVVKGISDYGNCMGIPTLTGHTEFSGKYKGNILVNALALGYLDSKTKLMSSKAEGIGNYVVYVGSATGRDGILGADMASQSFNKESSSAKPTVQIGDPFFGKQLMEACLESMRKNLVIACQDMGAAGLTCSSFEMSDKAGLGLSLHLDKVPLRDHTLQPEEILLSESQERMLFICEPSKYEKLKSIFDFYQLEISWIGEVLSHKEIEIYWKGKQILKVDPKLFTSNSPLEDRPYTFPEPVKRVSLKSLNLESASLEISINNPLSHAPDHSENQNLDNPENISPTTNQNLNQTKSPNPDQSENQNLDNSENISPTTNQNLNQTKSPNPDHSENQNLDNPENISPTTNQNLNQTKSPNPDQSENQNLDNPENISPTTNQNLNQTKSPNTDSMNFNKSEFNKQTLLKCLSSAQGRSRQFIYRQYDQRVGANTVKDASFPIAVLRLPESQRELGISLGGRPYLMDFDTEQGAKDSVFYPALQLALKGFEPLAVTDCLNFGNPEKENIMGEFVLSVEEIAKACRSLDTPIISGNVSFYNESERGGITASPAIGMIGLKENSNPIPEDAFTKTDERVYLIQSHQFYFTGAVAKILLSKKSLKKSWNQESPAKNNLTDSAFAQNKATQNKATQNKADQKDFSQQSINSLNETIKNHEVKNQKECFFEKQAYGGLQDFLVQNFIQQVKELIKRDLISNSHLVGKFGLAYSLARMTLKNGVGFSLDKSFFENRPMNLFQERLYEVIFSVEENKEEAFIKELERLGLSYTFLGATHTKPALNLKSCSLSLKELKESYFKTWSDLISL